MPIRFARLLKFVKLTRVANLAGSGNTLYLATFMNFVHLASSVPSCKACKLCKPCYFCKPCARLARLAPCREKSTFLGGMKIYPVFVLFFFLDFFRYDRPFRRASYLNHHVRNNRINYFKPCKVSI